jgi:hypothetical protein
MARVEATGEFTEEDRHDLLGAIDRFLSEIAASKREDN